ncbi:MAG: hypothetical protein ACI8XZ_003964 [Gammaproteobacteria bacterium]|jgi:hypothetical protein
MISRHLVIVALLLFTIPRDSIANPEFYFKPKVSTRAAYDNNPRSRVESPGEVAITTNEAEVNASYTRPTYRVAVTPRVRISRFTEETELDSEDYFAAVEASKVSERHQFFGQFDFERENSIFTEQTDSGLFNVNLPRTTFALNGTWQYSLSDRTTLSMSGNILDASFEEDPRSTFIDYLQYGAGPSLRYSVSDVTTLTASYNISKFKTPSIGSETLSHAVRLGFERQITESLFASFSLGHNRSELEFKSSQGQIIPGPPPQFVTTVVDSSSRSSGEIIELAVDKQFEKIDARFEWSRAFSPSSQGSRQQTEIVRGSGRYRITQFVDFSFLGSYRQRAQEGDVSVGRPLSALDTILFRGALGWRFSRTMRAEVGLQYQEQRRSVQGTKAVSERIFLSLRYTPNELRYAP